MLPKKHISFIELLLIHIVLVTASSSMNERSTDQGRLYEQPWLVFPPTAPTRHQLITGIGIPLGTPESIISGWVLKAQYFLPNTPDHLKPHLWEGWNDSRRSFEKREAVTATPLEHYEAYTARKVKVETEPLPEDAKEREDDDFFEDADDDYWMKMLEDEKRLQETTKKSPAPVEVNPKELEGYNTERSRWTTYKALEQIGEIYGSGGRECVLRSICEAASAEFTHTGGIFAELLHIIFTPSTTTEPLSDHSDNEYCRAEQLGREGAPCHLIFHQCLNSILDVFTGVHDPVMNTLTVAHEELIKSFMN